MMIDFANSFRHFIGAACIAGLVAIAVSLCAYFIARLVWDPITRKISKLTVSKLVAAVCVLGWIQYGSTKSSFRYDGGIKQGVAESYTTNDTVFISWQRDTSQGVYVPDSAPVYIDYRPNTETNAEWGLLAESTVAAGSWTGTLEGATNYDFNVWAYYIPPEPVHTNGVWVYKTLKDRGDKCALPLRARVEINGQAISTPLAKRRDYPYDAEVAWIQSDRKAVIDTGVDVFDSTSFEIRINAAPLSFYNYNTIWASTADKYESWLDSGKKLHLRINNYGFTWSRALTADEPIDYVVQGKDGNKYDFYINGTNVLSKTLQFNAIGNMYLFGGYNNSAGNWKLQSMTLGKDGKLVRDFIPVRYTNELGISEGALFDRVSGRLFTNAGTGSFVIGPDTRRIK